MDRAEVLQGTLELLVLKLLSVTPEHGWGLTQRLEQVSSGVLLVNQGSLYPALERLERKGWIRSEWRVTENNRRARYYLITAMGRRRLAAERAMWERSSRAVNLILAWAGDTQ
jgi:transcriptional regulator